MGIDLLIPNSRQRCVKNASQYTNLQPGDSLYGSQRCLKPQLISKSNVSKKMKRSRTIMRYTK